MRYFNFSFANIIGIAEGNEYQMHDYFQSNHVQEFLAGNHYLLTLKVPNNSTAKIQQNKKNPAQYSVLDSFYFAEF